MRILPIGKTVYAVSKTYVQKTLPLMGARVIPCKVKTYQNDGDNILTVCSSSLVKGEITDNSHILYDTLDEAILVISSIPVKAPAKKAVKKATIKKKK